MEHDVTPETTSPSSPVAARRRRAIYTAALAGGLVLGGFGIAAAQTDTSSPSTTVAPDSGTQQAPGGRPNLRFKHGGPGMMGFMGALHGELTVPDSDGSGYRTLIIQRGTVTDVSDSSVTVKSDDGYTKTYTVDDNTLVNAGNEGIGDVKKDDEVHVQAFVEGSGNPHAAHVMDATGIGAIRKHWHPGAPDAQGSSFESGGPTA